MTVRAPAPTFRAGHVGLPRAARQRHRRTVSMVASVYGGGDVCVAAWAAALGLGIAGGAVVGRRQASVEAVRVARRSARAF